MLVLSRKIGERILIGDGIAITVVRCGPGGVRLGIVAPPELTVVREELTLPGAEGSRGDSVAVSAAAHASAGSVNATSSSAAAMTSAIGTGRAPEKSPSLPKNIDLPTSGRKSPRPR